MENQKAISNSGELCKQKISLRIHCNKKTEAAKFYIL